MSNFKSINEVFKKEEVFTNLRNSLQQADVVHQFDEIFPDLKKIAKAVKVEKNIIYIKVENSVWRSELKFKQRILIEKINKYFDQNIVRSVKFLA